MSDMEGRPLLISPTESIRVHCALVFDQISLEPLEGTRRVGGLLGVAGRLSGTVSPTARFSVTVT